MVIYCNGIRSRRKRMQLAELLFKLHIGVRVVTETHLRKEEMKQLKFLHYVVVNDFSRVAAGKIGGGVLIMARNLSKASRCTLQMTESRRLELCSIKLFPTTSPLSTILLTGIYIPPKVTKDIKLPLLLDLSRQIGNREGGITMSRVLAGDFNTTSGVEPRSGTLAFRWPWSSHDQRDILHRQNPLRPRRIYFLRISPPRLPGE